MQRIFLLLIVLFLSRGLSAQLTIRAVGINYSCQKQIGFNNNVTGDGIIQATATGGKPPYIYSVNGFYASPDQNNGYFPQLPATNYIVMVTDATGATADTVIYIRQTLPSPSVTPIYTPVSFCGGSDGVITLNARGGTPPYLYSIDGGITFSQNNVFNNLKYGVYSKIVKDANGCLTSYDPLPYNIFLYPTSQQNFCRDSLFIECIWEGTTTTSCSNEGVIYILPPYLADPLGGTYKPDSATVISLDGRPYRPYVFPGVYDTLAGVPPGLHYIHARDTLSGKSAVFSIAVNYSCSLYITFVGVDASCQQSDGALTIYAANGTPPYTYTMDGKNYQTSNTFTGLASGNYSVTVKDANGETSSATGTVYNRCPIVSARDNGLCGSKDTLTASGLKGTKPYQFSIDGKNFQSDSVFTGLVSGAYTVTLMDSNGFLDSTTVTVNNSCLLVTVTSINESCGQKNGSITAIGTGGSSPYSYSIDGANFQSAKIFKGLKAGNYIITVKDATLLTSTTTMTLTNTPVPTISLGNDTTLCIGQTIVLNAAPKNQTGIATYFWQDGNTSPLYTVNKKGSYSVKVSANGCDTTGKITIGYTSKPTVALAADTTLCNTNQLVLDATYPQSSYLWQDGSSKPNFTVTTAGIYTVDVTNYCGTVKDSINVQYENCDCVFYIPSAFSPNGDGKNDIFKPSYKCFFTNYQLKIFNRFGKIIFTSTNADKGWDGTVNSQQQPTGAYVWTISYFDTLTGKTIKKTGTMVLVR